MSVEPNQKLHTLSWYWLEGSVATELYFLIDCSMVADCAECCSQNLDELYIALVENTKLNLVDICQLIYELTGGRTLGPTVCPGNLARCFTWKIVQVAKQWCTEFRVVFMAEVLQYSQDHFV